MKKQRIHHLNLVLSFLILLGATRLQAGQLDIALLFAGYEQGCNTYGAEAQRMIVWANPDEKGRLAPINTLPLPWRSHVGSPSVSDQVDHWFVTVPLRGVHFRGLQVLRFERWYGKASGISGWALVIAEPLAVVRQRIDEKGFMYDSDENFRPEFSADQSGQETRLVCDVSM